MKNIIIKLLSKLANVEDGVIGDVSFTPSKIKFKLNTFFKVKNNGDWDAWFEYTYWEYMKNTFGLWWGIFR